jgi:hypothetical protein
LDYKVVVGFRRTESSARNIDGRPHTWEPIMGPEKSADVLVRPPLHEQLTERLRDLIVHNELPPGERID